MGRWIRAIPLSVSPALCVLLAMMLLLLPIRWLFAAASAAAIHELFHIAAVYLCGGSVTSLRIGNRGAVMEVTALSWRKELLCALAGPFGGLLLLAFARWIPRIAVCGACQSIYNLLPVYPLDGGRAVRCIARMLFPRRWEQICIVITNVCLALTAVVAVYGAVVFRLGLMPLLWVGVLLFQSKKYLANGV